VAEAAASQHAPVYIVGGFVRDLLLEHPSLDFDIVVEGEAITLARALAAQHGGKVTSHSRFGTAKWNLEHSAFNLQHSTLDLISSRQEYYEHPTALPTVEHGSIKLDLHRRDFTINTLALRLDGRHFGELHDYYGGLPDLKKRRIRVLHSLSFVDDPTRMLRAVRYEQRYGFAIEPRTLQLMDEARPLIARLSEERLRHELDLILDEPKSVLMLARLDELGLLKSIAEVLPWNVDIRSRLDSALAQPLPPGWGLTAPASGVPLNQALIYILWLLDLPRAEIETLHKRLRFPMGVYKAILAASALRADLPALSGAPASKWSQRLEGSPILALYAVYLVSGEMSLEAYATRWQNIHSKTDGETLKALGLPPGRAYQEILWKLRAAWLDGEIASENDEQAMLKKLLSRYT
jgi:tRNA nucleotidyltransferase (CCA-adding enzyme)